MTGQSALIQRVLFGCGLILSVMLTGCTTLPDYAKPRIGITVTDPDILADAVTYRKLRRTDFEATELPDGSIGHDGFINAGTCTRIRPTKDSKFQLNRTRLTRSQFYVGSIEKIEFEAVMFPGCSWWNPAIPPSKHAYVLQHEQIHFALVELTARRLTADVREKSRSFISMHPTIDAVQAEIAARINEWIREASMKSMATHTDFDKDTSLYFNPRWQQLWWEKVERQLAELPPAVASGAQD